MIRYFLKQIIYSTVIPVEITGALLQHCERNKCRCIPLGDSLRSCPVPRQNTFVRRAFCCVLPNGEFCTGFVSKATHLCKCIKTGKSKDWLNLIVRCSIRLTVCWQYNRLLNYSILMQRLKRPVSVQETKGVRTDRVKWSVYKEFRRLADIVMRHLSVMAVQERNVWIHCK